MFTRLVVVAALVVAPFAVACGSSDDGSHSSSSDIKTTDGEGTLGAQCGGFVGIPCATGFECVTQGGFADAIGTCEPALPAAGSEGATCGGIAALKCNEGLECKKTDATIDATGTCATASPFATCHAVPACDSSDKSVAACAASDKNCYTRTVCGSTISCSKK